MSTASQRNVLPRIDEYRFAHKAPSSPRGRHRHERPEGPLHNLLPVLRMVATRPYEPAKSLRLDLHRINPVSSEDPKKHLHNGASVLIKI
jgi:hypothetical protein